MSLFTCAGTYSSLFVMFQETCVPYMLVFMVPDFFHQTTVCAPVLEGVTVESSARLIVTPQFTWLDKWSNQVVICEGEL